MRTDLQAGGKKNAAAVQWLASEQGQALFGDADVHDVFFLVDPQDITQQLRLSNYDAAILCPDQQTLQQLGGYESIPLSGTPSYSYTVTLGSPGATMT